jgi:hypothetical protein
MRPVHKIQQNRKSIVAFTWCGVDPCRKGVQTQSARGTPEVTCKECLKAEAEFEKTKHVRHPVKVTPMFPERVAPLHNLLNSQVDSLIRQYGVEAILVAIRAHLAVRVDGNEQTEALWAIMVDATEKVREVQK